MMVGLLLFFALVGLVFAECAVCDSSCGNWSCIKNCSESTTNPTFDTYRCAVDANSNGEIDNCSELIACQYVYGKYVCPTDRGDSLCITNAFVGPKPYDPDPSNPDIDIMGVYTTTSQVSYPQYQSLLSQHSLACPTADNIYNFLISNGIYPAWVCNGAFYQDAWLSYSTCDYRSYDGAMWRVKNNACSDPSKIWQKLGTKCYGSSWSHSIYLYNSSTYLYLQWTINLPQGTFNQSQPIVVNGKNHTVNLKCTASTNVQDASTGQTLNLCTQLTETVSGPFMNYTIVWNLDSSFTCPVQTYSKNTDHTSESLTPSTSNLRDVVVEERPNNVNLRGVGVDSTGRRCKICSTSMSGLTGGYVKSPPVNNPPDQDTSAQCANPRFFSGSAHFCKPGGLTTLGASCCGIGGWTTFMCSRGEKELKKRREADTCTEIGEYCSKKVLGMCLEKKRSYCCFNSKLARIFQECGRPQIGKSWGSPKSPDCSGFSIDELTRVDFSNPACVQAIEEWAMDIAGRFGNGSEIAQRAASNVQDWIQNVSNKKDYGGEK